MRVVAIPHLGGGDREFAVGLADKLNTRGHVTLRFPIPYTNDPVTSIRERVQQAKEGGAEVVLFYGVYTHMLIDLGTAVPDYRILDVRPTEFTVDILGGDGIWRGVGMDEVVRRVN